MGDPRRQYARDVNSEEGCLFYTWHRTVDDPNEWVCVEGFRDQDAAVTHVDSAAFKNMVEVAPDLVSGQPLIINTTIEQDDWGPMGEISPRSAAIPVRAHPPRGAPGPRLRNHGRVPSPDPYDLERFVAAQDSVIDRVRAELRRAGRPATGCGRLPAGRRPRVEPTALRTPSPGSTRRARTWRIRCWARGCRNAPSWWSRAGRTASRDLRLPRRPQAAVVDDAVRPRRRRDSGVRRGARAVLRRRADPRTVDLLR